MSAYLAQLGLVPSPLELEDLGLAATLSVDRGKRG